jgi:hypothetical protein
MSKFRQGAGSVSPRFSQGFQSDVEADFVSILEAVGYRFSWVIDTHRHSFDHMLLLTFLKCRTRKSHHSKREIVDFRMSRLPVQCKPDLMWRLRGQIVKSQRGQQTHRGFRYTFGNLGRRIILFYGCISGMKTPTNPLQLSAGNQLSDFWARDTFCLGRLRPG